MLLFISYLSCHNYTFVFILLINIWLIQRLVQSHLFLSNETWLCSLSPPIPDTNGPRVKRIERPDGDTQGDVHPSPARRAGDRFFWVLCKRWPISAYVCVCVCVHEKWPSASLPLALDTFASWPHTHTHTHTHFPIASAGRAYFLPISAYSWVKKNRMCFSLCVCVWIIQCARGVQRCRLIQPGDRK